LDVLERRFAVGARLPFYDLVVTDGRTEEAVADFTS
jgi:hypothetical protein